MAERNVLLKNVKHPFLVCLHYSFQTSDKLFFVLDFINGGEVRLTLAFALKHLLAFLSKAVVPTQWLTTSSYVTWYRSPELCPHALATIHIVNIADLS